MIGLDEVTGREIRIMDELCGGRGAWAQGLEVSAFDTMYAFVYVARKRTDPELTFDAVLDLPLSEVVDAFAEAAEADPTSDAASGIR